MCDQQTKGMKMTVDIAHLQDEMLKNGQCINVQTGVNSGSNGWIKH